METTSTTLRWAILLMALNEEIQSRVRDEIWRVLGRDRAPSNADRSALKYTDAVLAEVQRFVTLAPLAVAHCATQDCRLREYDIPKGTIVTANIYAAHHDPAIWADPNRFNPDANFVKADASGQIVGLKNVEYLIPFGLGKRQCLGEALAKQELFLFFVGLLQRFTFLPHPAHQLPKEPIQFAITTIHSPFPYRVLIQSAY